MKCWKPEAEASESHIQAGETIKTPLKI